MNTINLKSLYMKKYIISLTLAFFLVCIISCKKDIPKEPIIIIIMPKDVTGKWKWIFTALDYPDPQTGGPAKITPLNSGNTESMEFSLNTQWKKIVNNHVNFFPFRKDIISIIDTRITYITSTFCIRNTISFSITIENK